MSIQLEVWGDYACFTRPELKVERVSYDVMTPSAARGLLESIFWHPGLQYVIRNIYVMNPISFTSIRRNEVKSGVPWKSVKAAMEGRQPDLYLCPKDGEQQQRAALVLRDVHYVIDAYFVMTKNASPSDNPGKFCEMMRRRAERGQCYHEPYFGTREFPVSFRPWQGGPVPTAYPEETKDLGLMLYDMDYSDPNNILPMFFRATLDRGVLHVPEPGSKEVLR